VELSLESIESSSTLSLESESVELFLFESSLVSSLVSGSVELLSVVLESRESVELESSVAFESRVSFYKLSTRSLN
jgi:hypothetical protein